jgi:hypothetical protein
MSRSNPVSLPDLPNIEQLVDGAGQITIGAIHPLRCVAIAKANNEEAYTDEVNVLPPRQTPPRRR